MTDERYLEPELETLPRVEIEAAQERSLTELVAYAYERSPLYREVWNAAGVKPEEIRSRADFEARIPFIDKDTIREYRDRTGDPFGGLLCVDHAELTSIVSTTGTTGDATFIPDSWTDYAFRRATQARGVWMAGLRPADLALGNPFTMSGEYDSTFDLLGAVTIMANTSFGNLETVLDTVERYRPTYMQLWGPQLVQLEALSRTRDLREVFSSLRGAGFSGEPISARMRQRIEKEWGLQLFVFTSAGDTGSAWECTEHDGFHLWEDLMLPEAIEPEGSATVADGTLAELVSTSLDDLVAPLIRFRSGDLARFSHETCPCGRTHARMWLRGRKGEEVVVGEHVVMPGEVWAAVEQVEECSAGLFQLVRPQREVEVLRLRVGYNPERVAELGVTLEDLRNRVIASVQNEVGVVPDIELLPEPELMIRAKAANKFARIVKA